MDKLIDRIDNIVGSYLESIDNQLRDDCYDYVMKKYQAHDFGIINQVLFDWDGGWGCFISHLECLCGIFDYDYGDGEEQELWDKFDDYYKDIFKWYEQWKQKNNLTNNDCWWIRNFLEGNEGVENIPSDRRYYEQASKQETNDFID